MTQIRNWKTFYIYFKGVAKETMNLEECFTKTMQKPNVP